MAGKLKVLIVEDNRANLMLMEMLVNQLPNCRAVTYADPSDLVSYLTGTDFDIALIDYQMPVMNGVDLIKAVRAEPKHADKPLVMVTADRNEELRREAINAGAVEFLNKPIEPVEFKARLRNLARLCEAQRKLADKAEWLREEVEEATRELRLREEEIIDRLSLAADYKDQETAAHTRRMAQYSFLMARQMGLDEELCQDIKLAAPMHDIGKVGVRDSILLKPGPLDDEERAHMQLHAEVGGAILQGSKSKLLKLAADVAQYHHERWNGSGYPKGLEGEEIPLSARIVAVADVFDALITERPYKRAWTPEASLAHLVENAGILFDPACVAAFEACWPEILAILAKQSKADLQRYNEDMRSAAA